MTPDTSRQDDARIIPPATVSSVPATKVPPPATVQRSWLDRILRRGHPDVPVLRLVGAIGQAGPGRSGMTLGGLEPAIARAFSGKGPAVALIVNSPGGSPVQSSLIARRIRDLAEEKQKTVYAFVEDVSASGGYWLACAADEIIVDPASIIGSIGVISAGFGFPGLLERAGVERRVYTAGTRKMILDPFSPERAEDVSKLSDLQREIHQEFIVMVRQRRGERLSQSETDLFSGEFWSGRVAADLGLVDAIGHMRPFLRERFGDKVRMRVINPDRPSLRRRLGLGMGPEAGSGTGVDAQQGLARDVTHAVLDAIDERALSQRYGLS